MATVEIDPAAESSGKALAVIEGEGLSETLAILSDPEAVAELRASEQETARGESYTTDDVREGSAAGSLDLFT